MCLFLVNRVNLLQAVLIVHGTWSFCHIKCTPMRLWIGYGMQGISWGYRGRGTTGWNNNLYLALKNDAIQRYGSVPFPSDRVLSAIIFHDEVYIDDTDTKEAVSAGMITNSYQRIGFRNGRFSETPQGSLANLWVAASSNTPENALKDASKEGM